MCIGKCGWNYGNLISIVDKGKQMEKVDRRQVRLIEINKGIERSEEHRFAENEENYSESVE